MLGLGLSLTNFGFKGGVADAPDLSTAFSNASDLLGSYDGFAVDFTTDTAFVRSTSSPELNMSGTVADLATEAGTPQTRWYRDDTGTWVQGTGFVCHHTPDGEAIGFPLFDAGSNLFVSPRSPATQDVTVTAAAHTLSFDGTGTITLSGAYSGSLVGTGASERVTLAFTPSAGTLTLTVSGSMDFVQLEATNYMSPPMTTSRGLSWPQVPTSLVPTDGTVGTLVIGLRPIEGMQSGANRGHFAMGGYASADTLNAYNGGVYIVNYVTPDSFSDLVLAGTSPGGIFTYACKYDLSGGTSANYQDGTRSYTDTFTASTSLDFSGNNFEIGVRDGYGNVCANACVSWFVYVPEALTDAQVLAIGKADVTKPWDVFFVAGQSNCVSGQYLDRVLDAPSSRILQWNGTVGAPTQFNYPLNPPSGGNLTIGFAQSFANAYIAAGKLAAGRNVMIVDYPITGSSFTGGTWGVGDGHYNLAVARANACMAAAPSGSAFKGILWMQGESDISASGAYEAEIDALISDMRSSITGASNSVFVNGGLAPEFVTANGSGAAAVQAILEDVGNRNSKAAYADSTGLLTYDNTHYTADSQRTFGGRFFTAYDSVD